LAGKAKVELSASLFSLELSVGQCVARFGAPGGCSLRGERAMAEMAGGRRASTIEEVTLLSEAQAKHAVGLQ